MDINQLKAEARKANRAVFTGAMSGNLKHAEFTALLDRADELDEQVRLLEAITPAAHEDFIRFVLDGVEADRQAAEIESDNADWLNIEGQTALAYGNHPLNPNGTSTPEWFDGIKPIVF
jgi:hypothetical protein